LCHFPSLIITFGTWNQIVNSLEIEVEFAVVREASMKMAVFWVVAPCRQLEVCQRFRGTSLPPSSGPIISVMMEAASISETSADIYKTTRRYNPEDSHPQKLKYITK
jgi:hypothetical protein